MNQETNNQTGRPENNGGPQQNKPPASIGERIGETVRSAVQTGDLSRLRDLGPTIQDAVQGIPGVGGAGQNKQMPQQRPQQAPRPQDKAAGNHNPSWYGESRRNSMVPARKPHNYKGVGNIVIGSMGVAVCGTLALVSLVFPLPTMLAAVFGVFALGSGGAIGLGTSQHRFGKRIIAIMGKLEQKNVQTLDELAGSLGRTQAEIKKDIKKALRKNQLQYVYFDKTETTVMLGENNYHLYQHNERTREALEREEAEQREKMGDPAFAEMENFRREGIATLKKIREANDAIPGDEISETLDKLETTTGKIFACVQANPKKLGETRRFMNYYLPTTLKLVDKYKQYEEMEVQTPSILEARGDIEKALVNIDEAFNNMLDNLYKDDTLDIATDIEVLQSMLEQEGLTGQRFQMDAENPDGGPLRF